MPFSCRNHIRMLNILPSKAQEGTFFILTRPVGEHKQFVILKMKCGTHVNMSPYSGVICYLPLYFFLVFLIT